MGMAGFGPVTGAGQVGHGWSAREVGDDGFGPAEDEVAALTGFVAIFGAEGDANALLGVVRMVHGGVEPVGAVIVPDVVVGVEVDVGFHAPSRTEGVGHPLSQAKKFFRAHLCPTGGSIVKIPCLIAGRLG